MKSHEIFDHGAIRHLNTYNYPTFAATHIVRTNLCSLLSLRRSTYICISGFLMCLPNSMWLSCTKAVSVSSANTPKPIILCIVMKYFWATYSYKFAYECVRLLRCINWSYLVFPVGCLSMLNEAVTQFEQILKLLITFVPQVWHLH